MAKLPLAIMEKLLKEAGAERVSQDAKEALAEVLEDYALELGKDAAKFSQHAKRKTVRKEDVKLAAADGKITNEEYQTIKNNALTEIKEQIPVGMRPIVEKFVGSLDKWLENVVSRTVNDYKDDNNH